MTLPVADMTVQPVGKTWSLTVPVVVGENHLVVKAFDTLGHVGEATVNVARDSEVPEILIVQPPAGTVTKSAEIEVSGTVSGCSIPPGETVEICPAVTINGYEAEVAGGSFVATAEIFEGENRVLARAIDAQGKNGIHTIIVVRDNTGPSVVSSEPMNGARGIETQPTIAVRFSEAMAAPPEEAWQLAVGGSEKPASATVSGEVIHFQPDEPLDAETEVTLQLDAGLSDVVGNALVDPQALTFTTAASSLEAPTITTAPPTSPFFVCAASWTFSGTTVARAKVRVEGGATTAAIRADGLGNFSVKVSLEPNRLNRLIMTAEDWDYHISPPLVYEIVSDCEPPTVLGADSTPEEIVVRFNEPIAEATVASAIAVSHADGPVAGYVSLSAEAEATFTPSPPPLPAGALLLAVSQEVSDLAGNALAYPYAELLGAETGNFFSGTVIDDSTGRPLAGARLVVTAIDGVVPDPLPEQTSSAGGRFQIAVVAGSHDVTIARAGYTPVFRNVTVSAVQRTEVFDPRLTPASAPETVPAAGGTAGGGDGPALTLDPGALTEATTVTLTGVSEQGLPALLHYGWSPRGAVWL
ncbi:MAG: hypothetical protein GY856_52580, partial [bacterium]|nr:hypothetical protein [bacterium]